MKQNISRFYISIVLFAISFSANAQEVEKTIEPSIEETTDSIQKNKIKHTLRFGLDISKPIISFINDDFKGFEIIGDYRLKQNIYIATEIGFSDKTSEEDYLKYNTKGNYIKIGANYNLYQNWLDMKNEVYIGLRYGFSTFSQTLTEYTPNYYGTYFTPLPITPDTEFSSLSAHWGEFIMGLKVEVLNNIFLGASISMKKMFSQDEPDNFKNLYIPGYERVYLNNLGFGFNYTISYSIPLYNKNN